MKSDKKLSLTARVILGMSLGVLTGFLIRLVFAENQFVSEYLVNGLFNVGGAIFTIARTNLICDVSV